MELAFTLAKNATKPNPFEIISLQTTRKENNWKTEETLARAVVTLETERIKGSIPWCLWWWYIYIYICVCVCVCVRLRSTPPYAMLMQVYLQPIRNLALEGDEWWVRQRPDTRFTGGWMGFGCRSWRKGNFAPPHWDSTPGPSRVAMPTTLSRQPQGRVYYNLFCSWSFIILHHLHHLWSLAAKPDNASRLLCLQMCKVVASWSAILQRTSSCFLEPPSRRSDTV